MNILKKEAKKIKYVDVKNIIKLIYGIIVKRKIIIQGFNTGEIIEKIIEKYSQLKSIIKIKEIEKPLIIPSVDIHTGNIFAFCSKDIRAKFSDKIIFDRDIEIGKAVRASCSYPGVFSPCKYKNKELLDGGIRENIPWKLTKLMGADKVISVVFEDEKEKEPCCENIIEVISNSIQILCHELANYELEGADYLLKIKTRKIGLLDLTRMDELYNLGYIECKKRIKDISKMR